MTKKADEDLAQENGELVAKIQETTADLQRTRADFENYRKHVEADVARAAANGERKAVAKILPILDIFDALTANLTDDIRATEFGRGVELTRKNLAKTCAELNLAQIAVKPGDDFNHEFMNAVQVDETSAGDKEVVAEVLQNGYVYGGAVLRPAMVKVARK